MSDYLPSASYSFTIRVEITSRPNSFTRVASAIGDAGGDLGAIDLVRSNKDMTVRDVTVQARDSDHAKQIVEAVRLVARVQNVSDRTFLMHLGGKIGVQSRYPVTGRDDLSMIYTPGVARVCKAIEADPAKAWNLTMRGRMVMILSDGTRVLGLGDIGPKAALPVMEGKAMLFKQFGDVDAFPICLDTKDMEQIIQMAKALAPNFGAINLEDIESPKCFEIERRLRAELDIPVFHDDQHGTAIAVLAGIINSLRLAKKEIANANIVMMGAGAAGTACAKLLVAAGAKNVIVFDQKGAVDSSRAGMGQDLAELASLTNPNHFTGNITQALVGADIFIGLAGANLISKEQVAQMADDAIVFALANPEPEIRPEIVPENVLIMATGRSDYPNQINNALVFPGVFKGALGVAARQINEQMKLAAARALADVISPSELGPEYIIPSIFNPNVAKEVSSAVADAAISTGMSRKILSEEDLGEIY